MVVKPKSLSYANSPLSHPCNFNSTPPSAFASRPLLKRSSSTHHLASPGITWHHSSLLLRATRHPSCASSNRLYLSVSPALSASPPEKTVDQANHKERRRRHAGKLVQEGGRDCNPNTRSSAQSYKQRKYFKKHHPRASSPPPPRILARGMVRCSPPYNASHHDSTRFIPNAVCNKSESIEISSDTPTAASPTHQPSDLAPRTPYKHESADVF
ncbi:hypothetical protein R3P38DRAFT_3191801 [Favolaschia claudopus]|uniref:Uncharacterized protein n=1 Tax=Favolaschia claudopus TaxID=2862362 RepID=A0AAW0BMP8_9AGAR